MSGARQLMRHSRVGKTDVSPGYCQNYEARCCRFTTSVAGSWHPGGGVWKHIGPAQKLLMASKGGRVKPELLRVLLEAHLWPGSSSGLPGLCPSAHLLCLSCCALFCHETPSLAAQGSTPTPLHSQDVFLAVLLLKLMQRKTKSNKRIVGEHKEKRLCPVPPGGIKSQL
ncbi:hypothetical protein MG293_019795 [Ovis ammon polii]|uniref:Uncharacterized protein n=1 Tax=Ovis ammon polii TaxID=230172 RepID=A0AAD4TPL9_OVIAM|nr:hypothetical protein MG293_019795 [Ovis ammon polii]